MKLILLLAIVLTSAIALTSTEAQGSTQFTKVTQADFIASPLYQSQAAFGAQYVTRQALLAKAISSSDYSIATFYSIYRRETDSVSNYTFDVSLSNGNDAFRAVYTVIHQQNGKNGLRFISSYVYNIGSSLNNVAINGYNTPPISFSPAANANSLSSIPFAESAPVLAWSGDDWTAEKTGLMGGSEGLTREEFNNDRAVQDSLLFGLQNVIGLIVPKSLAGSSLSLTKINSVSSQVVAGQIFSYDVKVESAKASVELKFQVFVQVWTGIQQVMGYTYTLKNLAGGQIIDGTSN